MADTSLRMGDVRDEIEERLSYGDDLSEWIREACEMRLDMENPDDAEITIDDE